MNLNQNLQKNKVLNEKVLHLNIWIMILIFLVLSVITFTWLSKVFGIIFGVISLIYLIFLYVYTSKLKKFIKKEYEEDSK